MTGRTHSAITRAISQDQAYINDAGELIGHTPTGEEIFLGKVTDSRLAGNTELWLQANPDPAEWTVENRWG